MEKQTTIKCDACELSVQLTAVKVYHSRRVCPTCFQTLMMEDTPVSNRQVQLVQTHQLQTTVCPDCNSEIHFRSRACPRCGSKITRIDRGVEIIRNQINSVFVVIDFFLKVVGTAFLTVIVFLAPWELSMFHSLWIFLYVLTMPFFYFGLKVIWRR